MVNENTNSQKVNVHYTGTFEDGTEFDSSKSRGAPLTFTMGTNQVIPGFENAVANMGLGEVKNVTLTPSEGYGEVQEELVRNVPNNVFPPEFEFKVDAMVQGQAPNGQPLLARVHEILEESVVLDFNHPLAGKTLNFEIEFLGPVSE